MADLPRPAAATTADDSRQGCRGLRAACPPESQRPGEGVHVVSSRYRAAEGVRRGGRRGYVIASPFHFRPVRRRLGRDGIGQGGRLSTRQASTCKPPTARVVVRGGNRGFVPYRTGAGLGSSRRSAGPAKSGAWHLHGLI